MCRTGEGTEQDIFKEHSPFSTLYTERYCREKNFMPDSTVEMRRSVSCTTEFVLPEEEESVYPLWSLHFQGFKKLHNWAGCADCSETRQWD